MSETNGSSRLDRIEEILDRHSTLIVTHDMMLARIEASIDRQVLANEVAHERFEEENKRLLTAQILMNGAMQTMNVAIEKMADGMILLEYKLNALIKTVDDIIRSDRPQPPAL